MQITEGGVNRAVFITIRIVCLMLLSAALTFTTSPTALTDAIERLLRPLKVFHVKVHEIAMMMTIALRFVPTLLEETDKIMSAQKARGADMESGGFMQRVKALIPISDPAVCLGVPPGLRSGHGHGMPLLPWGRGTYPDEGAESPEKRRGHNRVFACAVYGNHSSEHFPSGSCSLTDSSQAASGYQARI